MTTSLSGKQLGDILGQSMAQHQETWHYYAQFQLPTGEFKFEMTPEVAPDTGAACLPKANIIKILEAFGQRLYGPDVKLVDFRWAQLIPHEVFELSNAAIDIHNSQPAPQQQPSSVAHDADSMDFS